MTIGQRGLLWLVAVYRSRLSRYVGGACRFTPSCSEYARRSIEAHGARLGFRLAVHRLLRCRPGKACGDDRVPLRHEIGSALRGELVVTAEHREACGVDREDGARDGGRDAAARQR